MMWPAVTKVDVLVAYRGGVEYEDLEAAEKGFSTTPKLKDIFASFAVDEQFKTALDEHHAQTGPAQEESTRRMLEDVFQTGFAKWGAAGMSLEAFRAHSLKEQKKIVRRLLRTGRPDPAVQTQFYAGVHEWIRRACSEGLITNNATKEPLVIPFQIFEWSELRPLPVKSFQVAVYERQIHVATASYVVVATAGTEGTDGEAIGFLQPDNQTVVDDHDNVVGVRSADGTLTMSDDAVKEDTTAYVVKAEGHEAFGALQSDGNTIVDGRGNAIGMRNADGSITAVTIVKIPKHNTQDSVEAALRELCMFNIQSDMILELKGGCEIKGKFCGLHMARGYAALFDFIEDVIAKCPNAASDPMGFNAAYCSHMEDQTLDLFATQLIDAVTFLHRREIYHFDLKPENVMINEQGDFLQLIDFGLAHCDRWLVLKQVGVKQAGECIGSLSNPDKLYFGSPSYVPHHELACDWEFIRKRDQWALGCMLFLCAYGFMLYAWPTGERYEKLYTKITERPTEAFSAAHGIPPRFVENFLGHLISIRPMPMEELYAALWPEDEEGMSTSMRAERHLHDPPYRGEVLAPVPLQRSPRFCERR